MNKDITLLDGSIGQEILKRSGDKATPLWSTKVMMDKPTIVDDVHRSYFKSGATVATTNTYPVHYDRLKRVGLEDDRFKLWDIAVNSALSAREKHGYGKVAASIGPLIASYRPDICPPAAEAEKIYDEMISHLSLKTDIILIETMCSIDQAEGALRASEKIKKPVWIGFSVDDFDGSKLRSGENLKDIVSILEKFTIEAVLINCSRPEVVTTAVEIVSSFNKKFGAYANAFTKISSGFLEDAPTVDALEERKDLNPQNYLKFVMEWVELGASIVGGCCEVGPEHIKLIANKLKNNGYQIV
jgi:homocysteine S-methyltransferase